jgi:cbb3-type cytochrome oxidase subunit 3
MKAVGDILGIGFLLLALVWVFWPQKPGDRTHFPRGGFPVSTNKTRNLIMILFGVFWYGYLWWMYPEVLLTWTAICIGLAAFFWVLDWSVEVQLRRHRKKK